MSRGLKPSAVLFFSASCGSCGPAAQALAQAQNADPQAANYVVVDLDPNETPEDIRGFLTDNQATTLAVADDTVARLRAAYVRWALKQSCRGTVRSATTP